MKYRWAAAGLGILVSLLGVGADAQTQPRGNTTAAPRRATGAASAAVNPRNAAPRNAAPREAAGRPQPLDQGPAAAGPQAIAEVAELQPEWWPLPAEHQKYVHDVLEYWEFSSAKIERYECEFTRWVYDPAVLPPDPKSGKLEPREITQGVIKYMAPDKAMYRANKVFGYVKANTPEGKSGLQEQPVERFGDHWVCDGKSIFEFDHAQKELRQIELPPEAQGDAISKGPLPFLFRAKKHELLARFWIQPVTPDNVEGEYWLEAWPKTREDAGHFRFVKIIIDRDEYLPKALIVHGRTWTPANPASETFVFEKRKVNFSLADHLLGPWRKDFYEPTTPKGWKKLVERFVPPGQQGPGQLGPGQPGLEQPGGTQPVAAPGPQTTRAPQRGAAPRR